MSGYSHTEEFDAHGHKGHGHVIVSTATLRLVLAALLFFTLLTVGASKAEMWLSESLNMQIPQMVNVIVALSIAVVKTLLVVSFFMQLRYDNPLNTMVLIFTVITVAFFLGFTAIDLGNRQSLDRFKGYYISPGGTGLEGQGPITRTSRNDALAAGSSTVKELHRDEHRKSSITDSGFVARRPHSGSSAERSRPVRRGGNGDHGHSGGH